MAPNPFATNATTPNSPAQGSFVITPADNTQLSSAIRRLTIGTAGGTVRWRDVNGTIHNTGPLPVGNYDMAAHVIDASGTTATGLTGWI